MQQDILNIWWRNFDDFHPMNELNQIINNKKYYIEGKPLEKKKLLLNNLIKAP